MSLNPRRTIDELKELRALTGDENGAQRVAFTPTWAKGAKMAGGKGRAPWARKRSAMKPATSG